LYSGPELGLTNQGLLEATNGGVLQLAGTTFDNAGANIISNGSGSIVELLSWPDHSGRNPHDRRWRRLSEPCQRQ
jgi:hypothetical protein